MDKTEKQFKEDFNNANKVDLSFDVDQLEPNTKKNRHKIRPYKIRLIITSSVLASLVIGLSIPVLMALLKVDESVNETTRKYTLAQIKVAESNSFKKLNNVNYPNFERPLKSDITSEEENAYHNFANLTYHSLVDNSKADNMSYSAIGLYSNMNEMAFASSRNDLTIRFDNLLGLDATKRMQFYDKVIMANSYASENASTQIKNAAFLSNEYEYYPDFVDYLTNVYSEAYQIDFNTQKKKMVEWVNQAVKSNGFIDEKFLELNEETALYLFSTLYFKNAWLNKYVAADNITDDFHIDNKTVIKTKYMKHSYSLDKYYDYGSYISFKDYYYGRYASITYLVPKDIDDNIFELTKTANIFEEDNSKAVLPEKHHEIMVNLKLPKFKNKVDINMKDSLENLGFGDMFDSNYDSFGGAFITNSHENVYLQNIKQRNEVEFNEDGTIVKSVSMASLGATKAMPMKLDTLDVSLNQPFIYIIRDINDVPIFVGHLDNPKA